MLSSGLLSVMVVKGYNEVFQIFLNATSCLCSERRLRVRLPRQQRRRAASRPPGTRRRQLRPTSRPRAQCSHPQPAYLALNFTYVPEIVLLPRDVAIIVNAHFDTLSITSWCSPRRRRPPQASPQRRLLPSPTARAAWLSVHRRSDGCACAGLVVRGRGKYADGVLFMYCLGEHSGYKIGPSYNYMTTKRKKQNKKRHIHKM